MPLWADIPPSEEVEKWATNRRHPRLHHDDGEANLYNKQRQMKRVTIATKLQHSTESSSHNTPPQTARKQPVRRNDIQSIQSIRNNRIVVVESKTKARQQPTSRQLFISDKPIVVKDFLSWKEAGQTYTIEDEQESKDGFTRHAFNQYASDRLGYFRDIPDTRHTL